MKQFLNKIPFILFLFCLTNQYAQHNIKMLNDTSELNPVIALNDIKNDIVVISILNNDSSDLIRLSELSEKYKRVNFIAVFDDIDINETILMKEKLQHYNFLSITTNNTSIIN